MTTPTINPATAKASWSDPTTNTDGTPITAGEITGYQLGAGLSTGSYTILTSVTGPSATTVAISAITPMLAANTYFAAVRAVTATGNSGWSNEFEFTIAPPIPSNPTSFQIA